MMENSSQRPSEYTLSRYLTGECSPSQRAFIERWIAESSENRNAFENFKQAIAEEEKNAPPLRNLLFKNRRAPLPVRIKGFLLRYAYSPSFYVAGAVALLCLLLILYQFHHSPNRGKNTTASVRPDNGRISVKENASTLRDSLLLLVRLTGTFKPPVVEQYAYGTGDSGSSACIPSENKNYGYKHHNSISLPDMTLCCHLHKKNSNSPAGKRRSFGTIPHSSLFEDGRDILAGHIYKNTFRHTGNPTYLAPPAFKNSSRHRPFKKEISYWRHPS